jgi:hypothetical protein
MEIWLSAAADWLLVIGYWLLVIGLLVIEEGNSDLRLHPAAAAIHHRAVVRFIAPCPTSIF